MRTLSALETYTVLTRATSGRAPGGWPLTEERPIYASYCSHRDHGGMVVFDPVYFGVYWDRGETVALENCLRMKRAMGITDVVIAIAGGYHDYLDGATFDFHSDPSRLHDLATFLLDRGFRPIVYVCTADGGTEHEIYDGTISRVCTALADLVNHAWYVLGWEVNADRGGAFTAGQVSDGLLVMRAALGDRAMLVWHGQPNRTTPASYYGSDFHNKPWTPTPIRWVGDPVANEGAWVDADDPSNGDEQGAFYVEGSGFAEIDCVFFQTDHGVNGPSFTSGWPGLDEFGQPRWWGRTVECLDRFLQSGTPMPGARGYRTRDGSGTVHEHAGAAGEPDSTGYRAPDWFAAMRRRGRVRWVLYETVAYEYIRDECIDEAVTQCTREGLGFGCTHLGCAGSG